MPINTVSQVPVVQVVTDVPVRQKKKYYSKVSANGQITVPKEVREELDLHPGDTLIFTPRKNGFRLHKRVSLREEMVEWRKSLSSETNKLIKKTAGWTLNQYHEYFDSLPENVEEMEQKYGFKKD